ncbi:MAG: Ig domain-containing protein [Balneolales bacterium]
MNPKLLLLLLFLAPFSALELHGQPQLLKDYDGLMEFPGILTLESSPAHLYVLSDREGLAVFRTSTDSLQWLYTSENMQRRGSMMKADIRYAYLYGNDNWLTIVDPTSVLGVYSSTRLPSKVTDAERLGDNLYIGLQEDGLARISLESPDSVDEQADMVLSLEETKSRIASLASRPGQLFMLTENSSLYYFEADSDTLLLRESFNLRENVNKIYAYDDELLASNSSGEVYSIHPDGSLQLLFTVEESIDKMVPWQDYLVIRDGKKRIWLQKRDEEPLLYREGADSGNFFTVSKNQLWMSDYEQLSRLYTLAADEHENRQSGGSTLKIAPVDDMVIPYPQPVLITLNLESDHDINDVQFQYRSSIENARIKNQGLYWQPGSRETGVNRFTVVASSKDGQTDSTSFSVDIRSFNAPPRFSPVRPVSIAVDESFSLPVKAIDSDGPNSDLIRYIGVDMPEGATLSEGTGRFNWTPNRRQAGNHEFQIIATDQFGAAASLNINITVKEIQREE